jgi:hypothetical protein
MWAISAIAQLRLNVSMDASPCPRNARGCADPDGTIRLRPGRSASALAQTTVHETVHFYLNSIGIEYGWPHEVVAHTVGYYFYNQLPASLQDDRTLSFWAKKLQADPITALSEICQGGYAHLGCQE